MVTVFMLAVGRAPTWIPIGQETERVKEIINGTKKSNFSDFFLFFLSIYLFFFYKSLTGAHFARERLNGGIRRYASSLDCHLARRTKRQMSLLTQEFGTIGIYVHVLTGASWKPRPFSVARISKSLVLTPFCLRLK